MANKYLIHGATYCGDGTASNEAASAGAAGAWNDINVFEGAAPAYGALAAGDVVYIRSKDAAGSDITRTIAANTVLGSTAATFANWITWNIDAGTVWSGIDGTIKYTNASTYAVGPASYNSVRADRFGGLSVVLTGTSTASVTSNPAGGSVMDNVLFDASGQTGAGQAGFTLAASPSVVFARCKFIFYKLSGGGFYCNNGGALFFYNCSVVINNSGGGSSLFYFNDNVEVTWIGGEISGEGVTSGSMSIATAKAADYKQKLTLVGVKYPIVLAAGSASYFAAFGHRVDSLWGDGKFGSEYVCYEYALSSRTDGYYPTLNAVWPDAAATPWSWYLYPRTVSVGLSKVLATSKFYSDAASQRTVTLEVLVSTTFATLDKSNLWIEVEYVDGSGVKQYVISRVASGGALDVSTASWSSPSYGAILFNKKKLSITTPTAIAQNSSVFITLHCSKASASTTDLLFICPDAVIS